MELGASLPGTGDRSSAAAPAPIETTVGAADLERAIGLLRPKEGELIRLAFPGSVVEVSTFRGFWETVVFRAEGLEPGPPAVTVLAEELASCVQGVRIPVTLAVGDGLEVSGWRIPAAPVDVPPPPRPIALANGVDVDVPLLGNNPFEALLVDIDRGGRKAWVPHDLVQRFDLRAIRVGRLFHTSAVDWFLSGIRRDETHPVAVVGPVRVY